MSLTKTLTNSVSSSVLGSLLGANPSSTEVVAADWWASGSNWSYDWANDRYMAGGSTEYDTFDDVPDTTVSVDADGTYLNGSSLTFDAAANVPRLDYTTGSRRLLDEAQAQNLLTRSEQFDHGDWNRKVALLSFGSGSEANSAGSVDPSGANTSEFIVPNTSNTTHYIGRSYTYSAGTYALSFYAKAGGYNFAMGHLYDGTNGRAWFNLSTGSVGTTDAGVTARMVDVGNGWYRCTLIRTVSAGTQLDGVSILVSTADNTVSFTGDGASGIYVWGAQLEQTAYETSYIPTTTAAVTRSADSLSRALATTKTVYVEGKTGYGTGTEILWRADDGTSNNVKQIIRNASDEIRVQVINATSTVADVNIGTISDNADYKIAARFGDDDVNGALNGTAGTADTTATMPTVTTEYMGQNANGWFNIHTGYTTAENDASLEALTV